MKEDFYNINNDLLVKFLLGETDADEKLLVENWLKAEGSNRAFLEHLKIIWDQSSELNDSCPVSEEEAWLRFKRRFHLLQPDNVLQMRRLYQWPFKKVAAVLILVIAGAAISLYFLTNRPIKTLAVNSDKSAITDTLSDGSVIILNKHSGIKYPEKFTGDTRSIALQGEAFFAVAPDKRKPFVIHVNNISIKVIGTSFNVRSSGSNTEVIVESGVVEVTRNNRSVHLMPGEKIIVTTTDSSLVKLPVTDKLYNYYRTKKFFCDDTPLWKLVEYLNQAYNSKIVIDRKSLRTLPLTTVFHDKPLDSILLVISETFNLSVVKSGDSIVLK